MFGRWAESKLYRKTMQAAVSELRRAARTPNPLEKLEALDAAEQRLRDAQWLSQDADRQRFDAGLAEISRSRIKTLDQAVLAVERLLGGAEKLGPAAADLLAAAGRLLAFLNHYLPEDGRVELLNAHLLRLGASPLPYTPATALSEMYHRPTGPAGCGGATGLVVLLAGLVCALLARALI